MLTKTHMERRQRAIAELQQHPPGRDPKLIVDSLMVGLTRHRDLLMVRAHDDVERRYGEDSMLGTSLEAIERREHAAKVEIEVYACIVIEDQVRLHGYLEGDTSWFLDWMLRLRLGSGFQSVLDKRIKYYSAKTIEERRLNFETLLQRAIPESAHAPLILFRLFPRSVRIVAATAFADSRGAAQLRDEQISLLPAISECHECHGELLDNDEICRCCGNPLWNYTWLVSD